MRAKPAVVNGDPRSLTNTKGEVEAMRFPISPLDHILNKILNRDEAEGPGHLLRFEFGAPIQWQG
jgi:hypothetical protein